MSKAKNIKLGSKVIDFVDAEAPHLPNASVGDVAVVKAVDGDNKATEWESVALQEELAGKVGFDDYATVEKGGVVKITPVYGHELSSTNLLRTSVSDYTSYLSRERFYAISKGTLENVLNPERDRITSAEEKIQDIELAKFPNVTIIGQPTINQGQISNFSASNYCQFPFVVNFQNKKFEIDFEFTTGADVSNQHNVLDSNFGLAFAVRSSKFVIALSTNGTNWDMGEGVGTHTVTANTTYLIRMSWDGSSTFKLEYSTDGGASYIQDITKPLTTQPYPKQIFIGISYDKAHNFNGIVNLNGAKLTIADKLVWQGMDDVGMATRMAVDMSNIDESGKSRLDTLTRESGYVKDTDYATPTTPGVVKAKNYYGLNTYDDSIFATRLGYEGYNEQRPGEYIIGKYTLDQVLSHPSVMPDIASPQEQLAARQRMGVKEIVEVTSSEYESMNKSDNTYYLVYED